MMQPNEFEEPHPDYSVKVVEGRTKADVIVEHEERIETLENEMRAIRETIKGLARQV